MTLTVRTTVALALAALGLAVLAAVVPTAAVLPSGSDRVWADQSVVLEPHDGPNGAYARIGADGNLSVDLAGIGANVDARSGFADVFDVSNQGAVATRVWLTHGATGRVSFVLGDGRRIDGPSRSIVLSPGERRSVSVRLHTDGTAPGTTLLRSVAIHAEPIETTTTTPTPTTTTTTTTTSSGSGGGSSGTTTTTSATTPTTTTTTTTTTTPDPNETVEVELDGDDDTAGDGSAGNDSSTGVSVTELSTSDLTEFETGDGSPRAVIVPEITGADTDDGTGSSTEIDTGDGIGINGTQAISIVNQTMTLSGSHSLVGSVDAVDSQRRIVKAVDIRVPADRADRPGTVRIRVARSKFADSDPAAARIGHLEDGGWQLLSTRIVEESDEYVLLEARTPGFSPFAVFAATQVRYEWSVDGETYVGEDVEFAFSTPGVRSVNLTVTDAFGQSDSAVYRILVNDVPRVTVDAPTNATAGDPVVLRADVVDEVGSLTATWTFPDGSEASGFAVERAFGPGEHLVRVTVEDEYGASTTVEHVVEVRSGDTMVLGPTVREVPLLLVVILAALVAGLGWAVRPRWPAAIAARLRARWLAVASRHTPRVVRFDPPVVDPGSRRFEIPALTVEDPAGDLETVAISVRDEDGFEVGATTARLDGVSSYVAEPQSVEPRSRVYVSTDRAYSVRVRVTDRDGYEVEEVRRVEPAGRNPPASGPSPPADGPIPQTDGSSGRHGPGLPGSPTRSRGPGGDWAPGGD